MVRFLCVVFSVFLTLNCWAQEQMFTAVSQLGLNRSVLPVSATAVWKFTDQGSLSATLRQDLKLASVNPIALEFNIPNQATDVLRELSLAIEVVAQSRRQVPGLHLGFRAPNFDSGNGYWIFGDCTQSGQVISCSSTDMSFAGLSYYSWMGQILPFCRSNIFPYFTISLVRFDDPNNVELIKDVATVDFHHICP